MDNQRVTVRYDDSSINGIPVLPTDKRWIVEGHPDGAQVFATEAEAQAYAQSAVIWPNPT